jgi:hypothetical protein
VRGGQGPPATSDGGRIMVGDNKWLGSRGGGRQGRGLTASTRRTSGVQAVSQARDHTCMECRAVRDTLRNRSQGQVRPELGVSELPNRSPETPLPPVVAPAGGRR